MQPMVRRVLVALLGLAGSSGCASEGQPPGSGSAHFSQRDALVCDVLVSAEPSDIPNAAEYLGLHGSLVYLLTRGGPLIRADGLVYLKAANADQLDELSDELAAVDGISVVESWGQADSHKDFERRFGDTGAEDASVPPEVLPAMVGVNLGTEGAVSALEVLRERPEIEAVALQSESMTTARIWLGVVVRQYEEEIEQLRTSGLDEVSTAASELLRLDRDQDEPSEFMYRLSTTTEQLVRHVIDRC